MPSSAAAVVPASSAGMEQQIRLRLSIEQFRLAPCSGHFADGRLYFRQPGL
jgi:hypothetical protein